MVHEKFDDRQALGDSEDWLAHAIGGAVWTLGAVTVVLYLLPDVVSVGLRNGLHRAWAALARACGSTTPP